MQNEAQKPHIDDPVKKVTKTKIFCRQKLHVGAKSAMPLTRSLWSHILKAPEVAGMDTVSPPAL